MPVITIFSSTYQYITLSYVCLCFKILYLVSIIDSLHWTYSQEHFPHKAHHVHLVLMKTEQHCGTVLGEHFKQQNDKEKQDSGKRAEQEAHEPLPTWLTVGAEPV